MVWPIKNEMQSAQAACVAAAYATWMTQIQLTGLQALESTLNAFEVAIEVQGYYGLNTVEYERLEENKAIR